VAGHKWWVRELLERLASQAGARDANGLAAQLALLVEGAIAVALVERDADGAGVAKDAARVLIRAALPKPPT
jgi:methylaspartate ammonia-lyase